MSEHAGGQAVDGEAHHSRWRRTLLHTQAQRPPLYRNVTVIKWVGQVATLIGVLFVLLLLSAQASGNLEERSIPVGYDFLEVDPGFKISDGIDTDPATGGRALWAGMVNTIRLAVVGIVSATAIGVLAGIGRLSGNWLVRRIFSAYVEAMRNVPLLVQILILNAVITALPRLTEDQGPVNGWLHLSNKGLSAPRVFLADGFYRWMVFVLIGVGTGLFVKRLRHRRQDATGTESYPIASFIAVVAASGAIGWVVVARWDPGFGLIGSAFDALAEIVGRVQPTAVKVVVSAAAAAAAALWIKREIDGRRTPAGIAKLTDDDYFRMLFAAAAAAAAGLFVIVAWPGSASWAVNSAEDLLEVIADKFSDSSISPPLGVMLPDIVQPGKIANHGPSGLNLSRGLAAVYFGVVLYTGAFIAEIVRGGILAVPRGQTEAAQAIGLRRSTALRRVILPQALRVILPPLGNQYLNLTKNTSLAIAVGYSDVVNVGETLYNQTGRSLEVVSLWMLFYLACSLTISVVVNFFNLRLRIVER